MRHCHISLIHPRQDPVGHASPVLDPQLAIFLCTLGIITPIAMDEQQEEVGGVEPGDGGSSAPESAWSGVGYGEDQVT